MTPTGRSSASVTATTAVTATAATAAAAAAAVTVDPLVEVGDGRLVEVVAVVLVQVVRVLRGEVAVEYLPLAERAAVGEAAADEAGLLAAEVLAVLQRVGRLVGADVGVRQAPRGHRQAEAH